jgi:hypothetical protein
MNNNIRHAFATRKGRLIRFPKYTLIPALAPNEMHVKI